MRHYLKPTIGKSPNQIILHCGTNDLKNTNPQKVAENVVNLAKEIEKGSKTKVMISQLVSRWDMNDQVNTVNQHLQEHCQTNSWTLIKHSNITFVDLN